MPDPRESTSAWTWDGRRYHDVSTGRFVGEQQMTALRDLYIDRQQERVTDIAELFADGDINRDQFITQMREEIRNAYVNEYALGSGGRAQVSKAEWLEVGRDCKKQYGYLNNFADEMESARQAGNPRSAEYIANRAKLYMESSSQAYEKARSEALGMPPGALPAYPGDGSTVCRTNCHCHWDIEEEGDEWHCYWRLGESEHCPDCEENASNWNPLVIPRGKNA